MIGARLTSAIGGRTVVVAATGIGLLLAAAGMLVLLGYAASEVAADPSLSLEDGYWIGRLPWTPIGIALTIIGATIAVLAGTLMTVLTGGNLRRAVALACLGVATFWWFTVSVPLIGVSLAPCGRPTCPQPMYDPVTIAYSSPQLAIMWLLFPALVVGVLALTSPRRPG